MKALLKSCLLASALAALAVPASAAPVVFDFEGDAATSGFLSPGALTTLTDTVSGLTLTLTRQSGARFDIIDATIASFPPAFGTRSLDPFFDNGNTAFVGNFSSTLSAVALSFTDFGADSDTNVLNAYSGLNGTGTLLGTITTVWGTSSSPSFLTASFSSPGINSITFIGGSASFPNSLFYDNITATVAAGPAPTGVPEPVTLSLFAAGLLGATGLRRRKKA